MKNLTFIISILILILNSCSNSKNLNKLDSDDYDSRTERIEILKKEIKSKSKFDNTEFELFNVNGFSNSRISIPGASSWDYKFVIKTKSSDIDKWTEGMSKVKPDEINLDWTKTIIEKRKNEWVTKSLPEFHKHKENNTTIIVYRKEGIIYKRVISN